MVSVLDKGFVELVDFMGGDRRVVEAARVSFDKETLEMGDRETKLITYMMHHRHGSPFEHSYFTFHVKAPLFVVREWQRHRIGSFNEMSGRYVEFEPEFYLPQGEDILSAPWRIPAQNNKQGSVQSNYPHYWQRDMEIAYRDGLTYSWNAYQYLLEKGVAKEMARMVLPLSLYTQFYWTVNARSLMNFLNLRTGDNAQWEIRQYAWAIMEDFREKMPISYQAWIENLRLAP